MKTPTVRRRRAAGARKKRHSVDIRWDPESEKRLRERLQSPEGQRALNQLTRIIAAAAVDEMLRDGVSEIRAVDPRTSSST